jgi:hypothetical protein
LINVFNGKETIPPLFDVFGVNEFKKNLEKTIEKNDITKFLIDVAFEMNKTMKQKLVLAGGIMVSCLRGIDDFLNDQQSDIDMFIIENGCPPEESQNILRNWLTTSENLYHQKFQKNVEMFQLPKNYNGYYYGNKSEYIILKNSGTISLFSNGQRKFQIILRRITTIEVEYLI